ncbi:hypothetical protein [Picrophilus oshimae]|uniref:Uncharacterized protein n=1 Tax=Picrophilus torridus (strain ATCC 700027 / DSM 9790 / JCM 10055 / NBRC 100828 / KAW 2/3) TaxID=1122961 RepID=Q6L1I4_PICTO|nr:hypothetical protein [Picrophilus oshimae]AAT43168.1 hypothetical protein PTO0583 [Picrophilus oshimae DSM 9789]
MIRKMREIDKNGNIVPENILNFDTETKLESYNGSLCKKNEEGVKVKNLGAKLLIDNKENNNELSRIIMELEDINGKEYKITIYSYKNRTSSYNAQLFSLILEDPTNANKRLFYTVGNILPNNVLPIHKYDIIASKFPVNLASHFKGIATSLNNLNMNYDFNKLISPLKDEIEVFSSLVNKYVDTTIIGNQIALIEDYNAIGCLEGLISFGACLIATSSLISICPLCAQVVTCVPACVDIFSLPLCLLCEGTGLYKTSVIYLWKINIIFFWLW